MERTEEFTGGQTEAARDATENQRDLASICDAIGGFGFDPPDSEFQRGYLSKLLELAAKKLEN